MDFILGEISETLDFMERYFKEVTKEKDIEYTNLLFRDITEIEVHCKVLKLMLMEKIREEENGNKSNAWKNWTSSWYL